MVNKFKFEHITNITDNKKERTVSLQFDYGEDPVEWNKLLWDFKDFLVSVGYSISDKKFKEEVDR